MYDVSATDKTGHESLLSNKVYINTSHGVLEKPSIPVLSSSKMEDGRILLEWVVEDDGGFPIDFYQLYRSNAEDGLWSLISTRSTDNATVSTTKITLFYRVRAHNFLGYSRLSNIVHDDVTAQVNTEIKTDNNINPAFIINIRDQPANCPEPLVILEAPEESTTSSTTTPSSTPTETTPFPIAGIFVFVALMAILPIKRKNN